MNNCNGKSPRKKKNVFVLLVSVDLSLITKIKIRCKVISNHNEVIDRRWRLIDIYILDTYNAAQGGAAVENGTYLYEED